MLFDDTITFLGPKNMGVDTKLVPLAVIEKKLWPKKQLFLIGLDIRFAYKR
jgi:hypothetical protein